MSMEAVRGAEAATAVAAAAVAALGGGRVMSVSLQALRHSWGLSSTSTSVKRGRRWGRCSVGSRRTCEAR